MRSATSTSPPYHDHSQDVSVRGDDFCLLGSSATGARFPLKLHSILRAIEDEGYGDIISWQVHGRAFKIHKAEDFKEKVLAKFFKQTKLNSFHRQLNLYGFLRISQGRDYGAYYHELFLRGKSFLSKKMLRQKIKGSRLKLSSSSEAEPNFYIMPFLTDNGCLPTVFDCENFESSNSFFQENEAGTKNNINIQQEDIDDEPFLNTGDFDTFSFDSNTSFTLTSDRSFLDSLIATREFDKTSKEIFKNDPDSISLELREVVQRYSVDECNLISHL